MTEQKAQRGKLLFNHLMSNYVNKEVTLYIDAGRILPEEVTSHPAYAGCEVHPWLNCTTNKPFGIWIDVFHRSPRNKTFSCISYGVMNNGTILF